MKVSVTSVDLPVLNPSQWFDLFLVPHGNRIWCSSIWNQHNFGPSWTMVKKSIFNSKEMPDSLSFKPALVIHFLRLFFLFVQKPAIFTFYLLHSRNICQSFGLCQLSFINWLTTGITYQYLTDFYPQIIALKKKYIFNSFITFWNHIPSVSSDSH